MEKNLKCILGTLFVGLLINLGIIGIKIFSHNYDVIPEAYIGYACFLMLAVCGILIRKNFCVVIRGNYYFSTFLTQT